MKLVLLVISAMMVSTAFAQGGAPANTTAPAGGGGHGGHGGGAMGACAAPFQACKQAGFVVGAHHKGDAEGADKGLWVDCIDAAADGKKQIPGLTQAAAAACRSQHKANKH